MKNINFIEHVIHFWKFSFLKEKFNDCTTTGKILFPVTVLMMYIVTVLNFFIIKFLLK